MTISFNDFDLRTFGGLKCKDRKNPLHRVCEKNVWQSPVKYTNVIQSMPLYLDYLDCLFCECDLSK